MALLGQLRPFHTRVRVYTTDPNPLHVDPTAIRSDLATRYVNQDCSFDLRVLVAREGAVVAAYLFPWRLFSNPGSHWGHGIDAEKYRTEIPDDIKSDHLRRDAG